MFYHWKKRKYIGQGVPPPLSIGKRPIYFHFFLLKASLKQPSPFTICSVRNIFLSTHLDMNADRRFCDSLSLLRIQEEERKGRARRELVAMFSSFWNVPLMTRTLITSRRLKIVNHILNV